MWNLLTTLVLTATLTGAATAQEAPAKAEREFRVLRDAYVARFRPLWLQAKSAWWDTVITGAEAAVARKKAADKALVDLHSDRALFVRLKALQDGGQVADPILRRELDVMVRTFLPGQADPALQKQIVELESDVAQIFNTYRSRVGERILTENDIRAILASTTDSAAAEAAWKAYMRVGEKTAGPLRELARLRNETARQLGFSNYYSMSLALQEIDEQELLKLFDELDALTRAPFTRLKGDIDAARAARFGISISELRPWHFGDLFFQDPPRGEDVNLDNLFKDADLVELSKRYYASVGLPCDDILARSDLYEKPGKSPHGACADMDRDGDIRIFINLKPNVYWADIILHELGHAVYAKYIRRDVPFLLRDPSHAITTEAVALLFGALAKNEEWLTEVLQVDPGEAARIGRAARASLRREQLIFSRWTQVMVRFEHAMYSNPDQDLGQLWWELKKRYQLLNPPETVQRPDYAAKVHVLTHPVYYHSYMMGELLSAQLRHHIARRVLGLKDWTRTSFVGQPKAGDYLREQFFGSGMLQPWNELTRRATGEPLTAKYFAEQFVK